MNDTYAIAAIENSEKTEAAHQWLHQHGEAIRGIEQKLTPGRPGDFPVPTMVMRKAKRKDEGPIEALCEWFAQHQIGLSVNLLVLLALTHICFPRARHHTRKFIELSYYNPDSGEYYLGWNDAWMVFHWIVVFTGLRASVMDYILQPIAVWGGVKTQRDQIRFAEQAWLCIYYSVFWTLGMYIWIKSDYWLNMKELWTNWPSREIGGLLKWYILVQYAFYVQLLMVIHLEKRRKDHWQMFTHHIVTIILLFTSYGYHQTKVANMILCMMDIGDIFLGAAKCLKYLEFTTITDVMFGIFMVSWAAARHVGYLMICYSVWSDIPQTINYGCYKGKDSALVGPFPAPDRFFHLLDPFRDPVGVVCFNHEIKWYFLSMLLFLQAILMLWFSMIVKVAVKVIRGGEAEEPRSDVEDEEDVVDDDKINRVFNQLDEQPFEEEVGVEALNFKGRSSASGSKRYRKSNSASGVSLPDRKELLGRIGCDKGVRDDL
ncbi:longevity-assurance protein [Phlyctema vagabunda]|uniref:Longevity-assurance protein n=1 Tax=Phlyctema vagabunda TaxID=108571 RepID=A0ABR4P6L9_9HELO